jgi:hypothetical protein
VREAEKTQLLEAVAREQAGKILVSVVVICELWRFAVAL